MLAFWNVHDNTRKHRTTQAELKQNGNREGSGTPPSDFISKIQNPPVRFFTIFKPPPPHTTLSPALGFLPGEVLETRWDFCYTG